MNVIETLDLIDCMMNTLSLIFFITQNLFEHNEQLSTTTSSIQSIHLLVQMLYNTRVLIWSVIEWSSGWSLSLEEGCMVTSYPVMGIYSRSFLVG